MHHHRSNRYKIHLVVVAHPALPDRVEDDVSALHDASLDLRILTQPPPLLKLHQRLAQEQVTSHRPASHTECGTFSNWPMLYRASALAILALVLCGAITSAFSASVQ